MIRDAHPREPFKTDKNFPYVAPIILLHPFERRDIDTATALDATIEINILSNNTPRLNNPFFRRLIFSGESLIGDKALGRDLEIFTKKIDSG